MTRLDHTAANTDTKHSILEWQQCNYAKKFKPGAVLCGAVYPAEVFWNRNQVVSDNLTYYHVTTVHVTMLHQVVIDFCCLERAVMA